MIATTTISALVNKHLCDTEGPSKIVLGWSPNSDGTAQKNGKHAVVELSVPILPEASHLLPLIKGGLTQLCQGLNDGIFGSV